MCWGRASGCPQDSRGRRRADPARCRTPPSDREFRIRRPPRRPARSRDGIGTARCRTASSPRAAARRTPSSTPTCARTTRRRPRRRARRRSRPRWPPYRSRPPLARALPRSCERSPLMSMIGTDVNDVVPHIDPHLLRYPQCSIGRRWPPGHRHARADRGPSTAGRRSCPAPHRFDPPIRIAHRRAAGSRSLRTAPSTVRPGRPDGPNVRCSPCARRLRPMRPTPTASAPRRGTGPAARCR